MAVTYVTKSSAGLIPAGVVTIDANEVSSYTAATPGVVNPANDDLATGDLLRVDVDTAGTGAKGLVVSIEFEKAAI